MQRKTNFAPNEYYHLYNRGVEKRKIFLNTKDQERFIALMYIVNQKEQFHLGNYLKTHKIENIFKENKNNTLVSILGYALMPNHFHFLVYEHTEGGISKFMARLLTAYSMYFNIKYQRSGPLFIRPFRSQHISSEPQFLYIFSYINLNPVGIIKKDFKLKGNRNFKIAEKFLSDYKYSSFLDYKNIIRPENKILDFSLIPKYIPKSIKLGVSKYAKWYSNSISIEDSPQYL